MAPQETVRQAWRTLIVELLDQVPERNDAAIGDVAAAIATTIMAGRHVYAFGAGHSLALVAERLVARGHAPEVWASANRGPV
jgi:uncharacterized phosphosugar-binding protein